MRITNAIIRFFENIGNYTYLFLNNLPLHVAMANILLLCCIFIIGIAPKCYQRIDWGRIIVTIAVIIFFTYNLIIALFRSFVNSFCTR